MSHHISNNNPKQPCQCATTAVGKHNITPKDLERGGGCGCHPQDLSPSRLDQAIEQYNKMSEEAEAARERFERAAERLEGVATEINATANKNAILLAISEKSFDIAPITNAQIDALFPEVGGGTT